MTEAAQKLYDLQMAQALASVPLETFKNGRIDSQALAAKALRDRARDLANNVIEEIANEGQAEANAAD